ncbi:ABC transporter ATP-binding protein [Aquibium sp. A9E412]|uniref:ABC transporter ATP-binding protein n=1 Tax=Aquibium sp. A9E412 TaxID=2976767 RepID=UPI0025B1281A|nr:ABC transporter ATP-binding protein [Aquibium sp. A9E412]MDN2567301.1 ABC transporter ATP-binding protein [Aquibium sp. A9E412]
MTALLDAQDIRGGYDETPILNGVGLTIDRGEIVTIAGTNGSGKSTLAKALVGLLPRCSGTVRFDGRTLDAVAPEDRPALGLSYVPQVANVFPELTIEENLWVVEGVGNRRARADELFGRFPSLAERRRQLARSLSGGERQQLAIARALMLHPKLMVMDEPSAALSPRLVEEVFALIRDLAAQEIAVLLVEQRAREALAFSHRGYIMSSGRIVAQDSAAALLADQELARLFLGQGRSNAAAS